MPCMAPPPLALPRRSCHVERDAQVAAAAWPFAYMEWDVQGALARCAWETKDASQTGVLALQKVTGCTVLQQTAAAAGSRKETPLEPAGCVCKSNAPSRGALSSFYMQFSCCIVLPVCSAFFKLASFGWFLASLVSTACNFLVSLF